MIENPDDLKFIDKLTKEDYIFHYTDSSTAMENILAEKKFRFNKIRNMDDPYERRDYYPFLELEDEDIQHNDWEITNKKINKIKDNLKIACFSINQKFIYTLDIENNNDYYRYGMNVKFRNCDNRKLLVQDIKNYGYSKINMWDKYAEKFKGVCFVFSKKEFLEKIETDISIDKEYFKNGNVNYYPNNEFHNFEESLNNTDLKNKTPEENARLFFKNKNSDIFFKKHIDFRSESEFRIILHYPLDEYYFVDIDTSLKSVIIGDRFPECYNDVIKNQLKEFEKVHILKLYHHVGQYNLVSI